MIRRKLTRIEVTLDDTKDLDDFFSKTPQIGLQHTACSASNSKLSNLFYQKQLLLLGKKYDYNQANDSILDPTNSLTTTRTNVANTSINTVVADNQLVNNNNQSTDNNLNESGERLSYNPQPYNPTCRFNQDTQ